MSVHPTIIVADSGSSVFPTLLRVLKLTRAYQNLRLAEIGLQNGQDEFLLALDDQAPKCVCTLAGELGVRSSTVSKMVDVLAAKGLVERAADDRDLRRILIFPTAAGAAMRRAVEEVWAALGSELVWSATRLDTMLLKQQLEALEAQIAGRLARLR